MQPPQLSEEEVRSFVAAAQTGLACGLSHPWEWYVNMDRTISIIPFDDQPKARELLLNAFTHFWNGCGAGPGDLCQSAGPDDFIYEVNRWYEQKEFERDKR